MFEGTLTKRPVAVRRRKPRRHELGPDELLCNHCSAKCCRYFALEIDRPRSRRDFDYLRWFLMHEGVAVFVEDKAWYLMVHNACKHLRDDHRCAIYDARPRICRDYHTDDCEYEDDDSIYDLYWDTPQQVEQYEKALFDRRKRRNGGRRAKPRKTAVKRK